MYTTKCVIIIRLTIILYDNYLNIKLYTWENFLCKNYAIYYESYMSIFSGKKSKIYEDINKG